MSPINAKKSFSLAFEESVRAKISSESLGELLKKSKEKFVLAYIKLLSNFSLNHPKPELIYKMAGDQILFFLLAIYPDNMDLLISIIGFMIKARQIPKTLEEWNASEEMFWLK